MDAILFCLNLATARPKGGPNCVFTVLSNVYTFIHYIAKAPILLALGWAKNGPNHNIVTLDKNKTIAYFLPERLLHLSPLYPNF